MSTLSSSPRYYWLADRATRWLAKAIDSILIFMALLLGNLTQTSAVSEPSPNPLVLVASLLLLFGVQSYLLLRNGQTIGKKLMRIRIVQADTDGHPSWVQLLLLRELLSVVISLIPLVGQLYAIADTAFIFREDRRCLHDLLASTKVVNDYVDWT